ncbi:acyl-CoA dehydrogenase/oxidase [Haematococcus lacustris]
MQQRRLDVLSRQLTAAAIGDAVQHPLGIPVPCVRQLNTFLVHDNHQLREAVYEFLKDDLYKYNGYLSLLEFRELTLQRLQKFVQQRFFTVRDYLDDPRKFMAALECLSWCDYSLGIKAGVHFTLCGGTVCKLGTAKHHDAILPRLDTLDLTGSFSMTELGHGSNVMGIETTATYDATTEEFVIHTPSNEASKVWIGGTGQHGKITVVFAQLFTKGTYEGVHAFAVRIRDDQLQVLPNIRIRDMGPKQGLNGVDNGQLWFCNLRVPRDALLDAYASVAPDGTYSSPFPTISQRFGVTVGGLTTGRVLIAQGGVDGQKFGLAIAVRYACARPQFGDKLVIHYRTHQARLLPALANTYALQLAQRTLKEMVAAKRAQDGKTIHVLSSGLKAAATWSRVETLQDCRECCGGQGFLSENKIGEICNDFNVDVTFEGDNTVMMQQVARACLEDKASLAAGLAAPLQAGQLAAAPRGPLPAGLLTSLLQYRQQALTQQLASEMAAASKGVSSRAAAEKAAAAAFDNNLDVTVQLGWAWTERFCLDNFVKAASQAQPADLQPILSLLASLYGMTRVERDAAFFLAAGVINGQDRASLRQRVHLVFDELVAGNGKLALSLVNAFGIPDHLLQAPIAFDWRLIGAPTAN